MCTPCVIHDLSANDLLTYYPAYVPTYLPTHPVSPPGDRLGVSE